ncbi:MAG: LamG domain-containing protein, partial [Candidatus Nanohaloarchaea archaeon]|nr:LamG domain-containing protein [Candidatus Nanohaloarchaea archaeon]
INTQQDWNQGTHNQTTADRKDNSGHLGLGYKNSTPTDNLEGYWRMDAKTDPLTGYYNVTDYSGNNNNGTTRNFDGDERGAQGVFSTNSFDLDGSNDEVSVGDQSVYESNPFSISIWVKLSSAADNDHVLWKDDGSSGGWGLRMVDSTKNSNVDNEPVFFVRDTNKNPVFSSSGVNIGTGNWTHIVGVYNGSHVEIWVNGTQRDTAIQSTVDLTGGNKLHIGSASGSNFFPGKIDEAQYYSSALSDSEVRQLYFHGRNTQKFKGSWNRSFDIKQGEKPHRIKFYHNNTDSSGNISQIKVTTSKGESKIIKVNSGNGKQATKLNFQKTGGTTTININFTSTHPTKTPEIQNLTITTQKTLPITIHNQTQFNLGLFNMTSADRQDNSGNLGLGY